MHSTFGAARLTTCQKMAAPCLPKPIFVLKYLFVALFWLVAIWMEVLFFFCSGSTGVQFIVNKIFSEAASSMFFRRNQHLLDSETGMCQDQNNTFNLGEIKV